MDLRGIDLNLLVIFDALLEERNITKAAKRLHLTQPAASNALTRLRSLFDDPLLVRSSEGMQPTPRALDLAPAVRQVLQQISTTILEPKEFDPAKLHRNVIMAATDYGGLTVATRLVQHFARAAPHITIEGRPLRLTTPAKELASGELDLALGFRFEDIPGLYAKILYEEDYLCVVRKDHPDVNQRLSLPIYCRMGHVLTSPFGGTGSVVDRELAKIDRKRQVMVRVHTFLIAPIMVAQTDYVATLPRRVAELSAEFLPIKLLKPPLELPSFRVSLGWHERVHHDPFHRWLRDSIVEVVNDDAANFRTIEPNPH